MQAFTSFEGKDPGFDIFVNGQVRARYEEALERLPERLDARLSLEFSSVDKNSMVGLLEQGSENPRWIQHLPQAQWFHPEMALQL